MKLTPEQQQAICSAVGCVWDEVLVRDVHAFEAGLRMGRAEGREQAAKAVECAGGQCTQYHIAAIRALPEEPT